MEKNNNTARSATVLSSYFNIFILFAGDAAIEENLIDCIYNWGLQLNIRKEKLDAVRQYPKTFEYRKPGSKYFALEQLYDLVYMIYLDSKVEEKELEILMKYAKKLGLPPFIVGDLVKAIATAPDDGIPYSKVKDGLKDLFETSLC